MSFNSPVKGKLWKFQNTVSV